MLIKLKFRLPEIVLGILLMAAVFAMGMLFESSRHQPANSQGNSEKIEATKKPAPFRLSLPEADTAATSQSPPCSVSYPLYP